MADINFIKKKSSAGLLRIAIIACFGATLAMLWAIAWNPSESQRAVISDKLTVSPVQTDAVVSYGPPTPISDTAANSVGVGPASDTIRYYENRTGRSFEVNLKTSRVVALSERTLPGFVRALWSPKGDQAIVASSGSGGIRHQYTNPTTGKTSTIGTAIISLTWSPNGRRIAFIDNYEGLGTIFTSNPDGTDALRVLTTRTEQTWLQWPSDDAIAMTSRRPNGSGADLTLIGLGGTLTPMFTNKKNLELSWSRDGKRLLFSYFRQEGEVALEYIDLESGVLDSFNIATSAAKCAWSGDNMKIVCGVPAASGLVGDIPADQMATLDDIVVIDLANGIQKTLYSAQREALIGVIWPRISSSGSYLVFTNLFDGRIWRLKIE